MIRVADGWRPRRGTCVLANVAVALVLLAGRARAAETPEAFVARWLEAQNRGDFAAYEALYAEGFSGVRSSGRRAVALDRAAWMKDRARMFRKPMVVEARGVKSSPAPGGRYVELEQTWASGEYKDVGQKRILLVEVDGAWRIAREELLESRRLLLPGQSMKVFVPAATRDEAEAARAELAGLIDDALPGVDRWPLTVSEQPPGVLVLSCDGDGFVEMAEAARTLAPRAVARVVREPAASCPTLRTSRDADERWEWPRVAAARAGERTISALVTPYTSTEHGDFGRERRGFHFVALYRAADGALLSSMKGEAASDFAELESVYGEGPRIELTETFVDAPCDGTRASRYRRLRRTTWVEADPTDDGTLRSRSRDRTLARGRCDDTAYRDWIRQLRLSR